MWDEQDGFFYDLLRLSDGQAMRLKVRSLVGLLPLCASTVFEGDTVTRYPKLMKLIALFRKRHPELASHVAPTEVTTERASGPATRRGGPVWSPPCWTCSGVSTLKPCWRPKRGA